MGSIGGRTATGDRRRRRVLFFPLPFQGHINPMFQLAGLLQSRGFSITVFHTDFNAPDKSLHPAYDFVPVPAVSDDSSSPEGSSSGVFQATVDRILALNRACEAPFRDRLAALLSSSAREAEDDVACLVADAHLLTLLDVARGLAVPTLVLHTGSAAGLRMFAAFPVLCDKGYQPAAQESSSELDAPVSELPPYRVRDLPSWMDTFSGHVTFVLSQILLCLMYPLSSTRSISLRTQFICCHWMTTDSDLWTVVERDKKASG